MCVSSSRATWVRNALNDSEAGERHLKFLKVAKWLPNVRVITITASNIWIKGFSAVMEVILELV